jgi:hypothetical protein
MLQAGLTNRAEWVRVHQVAKPHLDVEQLIASQPSPHVTG